MGNSGRELCFIIRPFWSLEDTIWQVTSSILLTPRNGGPGQAGMDLARRHYDTRRTFELDLKPVYTTFERSTHDAARLYDRVDP